MAPLKTLAIFFLSATVCFVVLMLPWHGLSKFYARAYRAAGEMVFGTRGPLPSGGAVAFYPGLSPDLPPPSDRDRHKDTCMIFKPPTDDQLQMGTFCSVWSDSRLTAYLPMIKCMALILATPIPWSRRWNSLFWGLLLIHLFIGIRLSVIILHTYSGPPPCRLFTPSPIWKSILEWLNMNFAMSTMPIFTVPVLIWLLVCFRRGDFQRLLGQPTIVPADTHDVSNARSSKRKG